MLLAWKGMKPPSQLIFFINHKPKKKLVATTTATTRALTRAAASAATTAALLAKHVTPHEVSGSRGDDDAHGYGIPRHLHLSLPALRAVRHLCRHRLTKDRAGKGISYDKRGFAHLDAAAPRLRAYFDLRPRGDTKRTESAPFTRAITQAVNPNTRTRRGFTQCAATHGDILGLILHSSDLPATSGAHPSYAPDENDCQVYLQPTRDRIDKARSIPPHPSGHPGQHPHARRAHTVSASRATSGHAACSSRSPDALPMRPRTCHTA